MSKRYRTTGPLRSLYRRLVPVAVTLSVCLTAAACSFFTDPDGTGASATLGPADANVVAGVADALSAMRVPAEPLVAAKPQPRRATVARPMPPPLVEVPQIALGHGEFEVLARLGAPQAHSQSRSARLWRYVRSGCAVDLVFFFDLASDRYRLAMIKRDGVLAAPGDASRCLARRQLAALS
jgi:hypothetical protein